MELLYRISTLRNIKDYHRKFNMKVDTRINEVYWTMKDGTKIHISAMDNIHLRNTILLNERRHPNIKGEFEKILKKYGHEDIYLLNFAPHQSHRKDIEKVFKMHPTYFYMRREEIYRMYSLQRKVFKYAEKRKIDYYGSDKL